MKVKVQNDIKECGLVVLQSFYKSFFKKWININYLKKISRLTEKGLSIFDLNLLAEKINLKLNPYEIKYQDMIQIDIEKPLIILIKQDEYTHYVILEKKLNDFFQILDPVKGKILIDFKRFKNIYLNIAITVEKNQKIKKLDILEAKLNLKMKNFYTSWIIFFSLFILLFTFFSGFLMKFIIDEVIPSNNKKLLFSIISIFSTISLVNIITIFSKKYILSILINKIIYQNFKQYLKVYDKLNLIYSNKITNIDHLRRINILDSYLNYKMNLKYFLLVEILNLILSSAFLVYINWEIFLIALIMGFLILIVNFSINKALENKYKNIQKNNLKFSSILIDKIYSKNELKNATLNKFLNQRTFKYKKGEIKSSFIFSNIINLKNSLLKLLDLIGPIIIIYLMTLKVINQEMSIGSLLLFLNVFNFFSKPFYNFANIISEIPIQKQNENMLDFILNGEIEKNQIHEFNEKITSIILKDFSFSYTSETNLFENINFIFENNINLKGSNGSGKSTLMKIISFSLIKKNVPIFVNQKNIHNYNLNSLREKIIYLYNNFYFFKSTLDEFLTFNDVKQKKKWKENFHKYNFQKIFDEMNLSKNQIIESNGSNLSSGQKQLIIILKLFVKKYDAILLDEIFENIDKNLFFNLKEKILDFQNDAIFIEISHNNNYLKSGNELYI